MKAFANVNARDCGTPSPCRTLARRPRRAVGRRRQRPARTRQGAARHAGCHRRSARRSRNLDQATAPPAGCPHRRLDDARRDGRHPMIRRALHRARRGRRTGRRRRRFAMSARWRATSASGRGAGIPERVSRASRPAATPCFACAGENQFHAIFGGGPSYIVHPSDTAPALVALDARVPHHRACWRPACAGGGVLRAARQERGARERRWPTTRCSAPCCCRRRVPAAQHLRQGAGSRSVDPCDGRRGRRPRDATRDVCRARANRARRRGADPVARAGGRETAGRPAHHAGARRAGRRERRSPAPCRSRRTATRSR